MASPISLVALLGVGLLWASEAVAQSLSPGMSLVAAGDRSWYAGNRREARDAFRAAIDTGEPAATAMARLRLLSFSGNLGMAWHGPRYDEAIDGCSASEAWCLLALADFHLLAPAEVGADKAEAKRLASEAARALPGPAAARLYLATGDRAWLDVLEQEPRDGLGDAILARLAEGVEPVPPGPGTWFLGLGLLGAPGLGFGGGLRFVHPDLGWHAMRLDLQLAATTRGSAFASAGLLTPGRRHVALGIDASQVLEDWYPQGEAVAVEVGSFGGSVAPGLRGKRLTGRLGAQAHGYQTEDWEGGSWGPTALLAWNGRQGPRGLRWVADASSSLRALGADLDHVDLGLEISQLAGGPWETVLGWRVLGEVAPLPDTPFFLLPAAGGADVLRGAPSGRFRGAGLVAADLELRRMLVGPLEGVVFGDGAWIADAGSHGGGGLGLRIYLPPRSLNIVRLDVAWSDVGWGITTGWGEVF